MINRCAVTLTRKKPFQSWLENLPDPEKVSLEELDEDSPVYLIPDYDMGKDRESFLELSHSAIFEVELHTWWTAEKDWPQNRTFEMFKQWFDYKFHSIVVDLVDEALHDDEM